MATIRQRKSKYSVIYWYINDLGERKQKWDTLETKKEANRRKLFVEYYQETHGQVLVPDEEGYFGSVSPTQMPSAPASKSETESVFAQPQDARARVKDPSMTFREFLEIFVKVYGASAWAVSTYSNKTAQIRNYINPYIGDWKLTEITPERLSAYYADLLKVEQVPSGHHGKTGKCVQPAGVKKVHDVVRCALNQAIRWGYLDRMMPNPANFATLPKRKKTRRKVWSVSTFREALPRVGDNLLAIAMNLAFSCSLRVGEIAGLTWDDVVIDEKSIAEGNARIDVNKILYRVDLEAMEKLNNRDIVLVFPPLMPRCTTRLVLKYPKSETSSRVVWLPKTVAYMLADWRKRQDEMREFLGADYHDYNLVLALDNGNPVESRILRTRLDDFCDATGYERVTFHSLRHLSTKYKLKITHGDVKSVQGDTGHAEAEMVTDVYSEIEDEDRRDNAALVESDFYDTENHEDTTNIEEALRRALRTLPPERVAALLVNTISKPC